MITMALDLGSTLWLVAGASLAASVWFALRYMARPHDVGQRVARWDLVQVGAAVGSALVGAGCVLLAVGAA